MNTKIEIFTPVESRNPIYLGNPGDDLFESILREHQGRTLAEIKEDGYRMQIHKKGGEVKAFTRQMNNYLLELFPELQTSLRHLPDCILDAELIGDGKIGHEGFAMVKKRFRSRMGEKGVEQYLSSGLTKDVPVALRVFDTLYWENEALVDQPLWQRRRITEDILEKKIKPSEQREILEAEQLDQWFHKLVGRNYEGLVCKNPNSLYCPGARDSEWIKVKRAENLDLIVLGVYLDSKNPKEISQILCGTLNPETGKYETLAKVNAKREGMNQPIDEMLRMHYVIPCPSSIDINPVLDTANENPGPDYWIEPQKSLVVEVAAMNIQRGKNWHSCGYDGKNAYSLRIGWLKDIRYDKPVSQASTLDLVKKLYQQGKE